MFSDEIVNFCQSNNCRITHIIPVPESICPDYPLDPRYDWDLSDEDLNNICKREIDWDEEELQVDVGSEWAEFFAKEAIVAIVCFEIDARYRDEKLKRWGPREGDSYLSKIGIRKGEDMATEVMKELDRLTDFALDIAEIGDDSDLIHAVSSPNDGDSQHKEP